MKEKRRKPKTYRTRILLQRLHRLQPRLGHPCRTPNPLRIRRTIHRHTLKSQRHQHTQGRRDKRDSHHLHHPPPGNPRNPAIPPLANLQIQPRKPYSGQTSHHPHPSTSPTHLQVHAPCIVHVLGVWVPGLEDCLLTGIDLQGEAAARRGWLLKWGNFSIPGDKEHANNGRISFRAG